MSVAVEFLSIKNPNSGYGSLPLKRSSIYSSMAVGPQSSLKFRRMFKPRVHKQSIDTAAAGFVTRKGLGAGFPSPRPRGLWSRSIVIFSASQEDPKHQDIEVEKESGDLNLGGAESQEAWEQTLASFKEHALKLQNVSQEAYEIYSKKAMVILKETSEQLKIQADKARDDLSILAKEIGEESKEYLHTAVENSPEPLKEVMETFSSSSDDLDEISKVRDFYLGIPYGLLLFVTGFLSFMLTGSISAIRFGIILGGALLALSLLSLRSYKRGERHALALAGQGAIASIIFLREIRLLSQRASFLTLFGTAISGMMVGFYIYRITLHNNAGKRSDLGRGSEN